MNFYCARYFSELSYMSAFFFIFIFLQTFKILLYSGLFHCNLTLQKYIQILITQYTYRHN